MECQLPEPMEQRKQPAMATHTNDTQGLGELLRCAREGRGLTLEQISNETKIPRRHLQALEQDNKSAIPVEFYRRAAIRAYARAVRLDQNIVLAELERAPQPPVPREHTFERVRSQKPTLFGKRLLIAAAVLLAAAVGRLLVEREAVHDGGTRGSIAESRNMTPAPDTVKPVPDTAFIVTSPLPLSDRSPAAAIQTAEVPATAASNDDQALTTGDGETRAAESVTELIVSTQPEGARVTVNGIAWGTAPVTVRYLPAGQKRIRVTKDGYATEERLVRLVDGHPTTVDIQLQSAP
jgi:cytoskeleton protein RodZ